MIAPRFTLFGLFGFTLVLDGWWLPLGVLLAWTMADAVFPYLVPELQTSLYWGMAVAGTFGLLVSVIVREVVQIVAASLLAVPLDAVRLQIFGGIAESDAPPRAARREAGVASAGAGASLLIGVILLLLLFQAGDAGTPLAVAGVMFGLGFANFGVALFNLLPAYPLSGGRILCAVLQRWTDDRRAVRIAAATGAAIAAAGVAAGLAAAVLGSVPTGLWLALIGLLLLAAALRAYRRA